MKRKIAIFLLCLLLCGCTAVRDELRMPETQAENQTERITTQPVKASSKMTQEQESQQAIMTQVPTESQTSTSPPVPTQSPAPTENPRPTRPPATSPPAAEPTEPAPTELTPSAEPTEPPTEPSTEPPFDIDAWVSFAREYAVGLGLVLDNAATSCWDNPILASAQSRYLERDLKGVLEDYASAPDISQVWIWSELRPDGRYDIYIGYA